VARELLHLAVDQAQAACLRVLLREGGAHTSAHALTHGTPTLLHAAVASFAEHLGSAGKEAAALEIVRALVAAAPALLEARSDATSRRTPAKTALRLALPHAQAAQLQDALQRRSALLTWLSTHALAVALLAMLLALFLSHVGSGGATTVGAPARGGSVSRAARAAAPVAAPKTAPKTAPKAAPAPAPAKGKKATRSPPAPPRPPPPPPPLQRPRATHTPLPAPSPSPSRAANTNAATAPPAAAAAAAPAAPPAAVAATVTAVRATSSRWAFFRRPGGDAKEQEFWLKQFGLDKQAAELAVRRKALSDATAEHARAAKKLSAADAAADAASAGARSAAAAEQAAAAANKFHAAAKHQAVAAARVAEAGRHDAEADTQRAALASAAMVVATRAEQLARSEELIAAQELAQVEVAALSAHSRIVMLRGNVGAAREAAAWAAAGVAQTALKQALAHEKRLLDRYDIIGGAEAFFAARAEQLGLSDAATPPATNADAAAVAAKAAHVAVLEALVAHASDPSAKAGGGRSSSTTKASLSLKEYDKWAPVLHLENELSELKAQRERAKADAADARRTKTEAAAHARAAAAASDAAGKEEDKMAAAARRGANADAARAQTASVRAAGEARAASAEAEAAGARAEQARTVAANSAATLAGTEDAVRLQLITSAHHRTHVLRQQVAALAAALDSAQAALDFSDAEPLAKEHAARKAELAELRAAFGFPKHDSDLSFLTLPK
jgi:hypothetical protein